jgi:hypothetical protein
MAPAGAIAEVVVNSTGDEADLVGIEGCQTLDGKCTLRAAIEVSNASEGWDEMVFDETLFDGQATGTIALGEGLPPVTGSVLIKGRQCPTAAGVPGPCVGVEAVLTEPALIVEAEEVEIEGLSITGAEVGIAVEGFGWFNVAGSWFGVRLDGSYEGNATGISIGPGSTPSRIGGEGPGVGNLFANSTGTGLDIVGAANAKVLGNSFGLAPDGVTEAGNGKDIEIASVPGFEATGNSIGTRVSPEAAATPECDGGCNLISGAAESGIDLAGEGAGEAPARATTIAGNHIGLNATGTASVPNAGAGIHVGEAQQTVIGGPRDGEANYLSGGTAAVLAGPSAEDLVVRNNGVGMDPAGAEPLAAPDDGIVVDSEGLASPAVEAVIAENGLWMQGGVAIAQKGFGAWIFDNLISGAKTGIRAHGSASPQGNLIEGNSVEEVAGSGILIESGLNEVFGNEVFAAAGAGIRIQGTPPPGVTGNLIGGDTATEENLIVGSVGAAIEIVNAKATNNEVARNRGSLNGGLFIDLVASPPTATKGPNNGIEPPTISASTEIGAAGGAQPGAKVRLFRKRLPAAGEIESFLGEATADAGGGWQISYDAAIPAGTLVAATQTSKAGGSSELAVAASTGAGGGGGGPDAGAGPAVPGGGAAADGAPPQTMILKGPRARSRRSVARFTFASDADGTTFACRLDGGPFRPCDSPKRYGNLRPGRHVFTVRAVDPAGHADPTPAKRKFTVLD